MRTSPNAAFAERHVAAWIFLCLLISYGWFFQGGGFNPNARLATTRAIVEHGTFAIDAFPHTGDWAEFGGHRYANKAPALSVIATPIWILARTDREGVALSRSAWWVNLGTNALPAALFGLLLFGTLARLGVKDPTIRAGAVLSYGLGTLAFPYATALYAHQPAAMCGFAAFAALLDPGATRRRAALAGALVGLAVTLELSSAVVVLMLGAWLLVVQGRRRQFISFVCGGLPFAAALAAYNASLFGSPVSFWFQLANPDIEVRVAGDLFSMPNPVTVLELTVLPYRGLLPTSPILLLALGAWPAFAREQRSAARVCAGIVLGFVALVSGFHAWYGGWTPGARYLIPALPFLALPMAFGFARWPRTGIALGTLSAGFMLAFTATAVEIPAVHAIPLLDFALPHLLDGAFSVNPQALDSLLPPDAYVAGAPQPNDASFNWGERLIARGWPSLMPVLIVWSLTAIGLWRGRVATEAGKTM